jgi:HPt (histidine-containing phosphotransfer) domain-containing protein
MSSNSQAPVFDPETLEQLLDLVDGDDTSFLSDLFQSYVQTATESLSTLRGPANDDLMRRAAHTLKGSSLNVGAVAVASVCRQLEADLRQNRVADLPDRLARLEAQVQRVVETYPETIATLQARAIAS